MDEHPIHDLMTTTMESLKDMIEVNTIIGEPVESPDGSVIIPVSKLGFGFAAGGSEFSSSEDESKEHASELPFGGGSGGGVSINPVAFLIVNEKETKIIHLDESTHLYEKIIDAAPFAAEKIQDILNSTNRPTDKTRKKEEQKNYEI